MALTTHPTSPYFDDYNETKNYMRILFRPGYSVQARELTQLQTAIQGQIDRFGQHVFKNGSPVIGGQPTINTRYAFVKLESTFTDAGVLVTVDDYAATAVGRVLTGSITGVTAIVLQIVPKTTTSAGVITPLTAYVRYTSSATDNVIQVFGATEVLTWTNPLGAARKFKVTAAATIPVGYGTQVSVNEGVYFIAGNFVHTPASSIIVDKYGDRPSIRVVYTVSENIVTQATDATLADNALGSPNAAAPGAHRYQIRLTLATQPASLEARTANDIIQLLQIQEGRVVQQARTQYSELADTLAQRTFEESGNYTVRPFQINAKEYFNSGTNGGLYTTAQIRSKYPSFTTDALAEAFGKANLAVGLESSTAYVSGYRIETLDTTYVRVPKARDEAYFNAASVQCNVGNYVLVKAVTGLPDINTFSTLNLLPTVSGAPGPTAIGSARARGFEFVSTINSVTTYKLYLFDVKMNSGAVLASVDFVSQSATGFAATIADTTATLYDTGYNSLLFKLPVNAVSSLRTRDNLIDTLYYVKNNYSGIPSTASSITTVTINPTAANEIFYSTTAGDYQVVNSSGTVLTCTVVINGNGASVTLTLTGWTSGSVYIIAPTRRNLRERIKTHTTNVNLAIATPNIVAGGYDSLQKADLTNISGIYLSASGAATTSDLNVTDRYIIDNGQRDNFYDLARIQLKAGATAPSGTQQLLVVFSHFTHNPGDYFSADSYVGFDYGSIPVFQSSKGQVQLRDTLDFRPTLTNTSSFSAASVVAPNTIVTADIQYYLPRIDKIYLDKQGVFGVIPGISELIPRAPKDLENVMILYVIALEAYTFSLNEVTPTIIDNRRYTMRDIGKLERRINKLEYYTSLSLLEKSTSAQQIFNVAGDIRYKNGFIVDSFTGHSIGDVSHPDYRCSIDSAGGKLRPKFYSDNIKLNWNPTNSASMRKTGPLLTLNYSESTAISQPYASESEAVNPYSVFNWRGRLSLSPNTDEWKETQRKPDVIIDQTGSYDSLVYMTDSSSNGTVWNDWQVSYLGVSHDEIVSQTSVDSPTGGDGATGATGYKTTVTTGIRSSRDTQSTRTGIRTTTSWESNTTATGDLVLETNVIPFIRSRKIYFSAIGMKPNTKVYAFFDNQSVAAYVREEPTFVEYASRTDTDNYIDRTSHPAVATDLITDAAGSITGSFVIPNTQSFKIRTGTRIFRISNSATNSNSTFTSASAEYTAAGLIDTVQNTLVTTRRVSTTSQSVSQTRGNGAQKGAVRYSTTESYTANPAIAIVAAPAAVAPAAAVTTYTSSTLAPGAAATIAATIAAGNTILGTVEYPLTKYIWVCEAAPTYWRRIEVPYNYPWTTNQAVCPVVTPTQIAASLNGMFGMQGLNIPRTSISAKPADTTGWTAAANAAAVDDVPVDTYATGSGSSITKTTEDVSQQSGADNTGVQTQGEASSEDCYVDPLAQTFKISTAGGIFATSLELYFQQKDANIPVTVHLRTVENGIPTSKVVPFSEITLAASDVATSTDATLPTVFTFEAPVHLSENVEYCFVVMANSDEYRVWISKIGGQDVTDPEFAITKQPYNGVMFTSQNASTWSPEQTKDIKFLLTRAVFDQRGSASFSEVDIPTVQLNPNPIYTTSGSSTVRVYHPDHGHFPGSNVTLSGIASSAATSPANTFVNGILLTSLSTTHTVVAVEADSYTITATIATASGFAGGSIVYATENRVFDVFHPIIQQIVLPDTAAQYAATVTSAKSLAGSEQPYIVSAAIDVYPNANNYMARPQVVLSQPNYAYLSSGSKSFILTANFQTQRNNLSPVIDLERLSLVTIANRIDNPASTTVLGVSNAVNSYIPETTAVGGSALAKYITRKVELNDPATALKIFILANRPAAAGIALYYKVLAKGSDTNFESLPWILGTPDVAIPSTDDPSNFAEVEYTINEAQLVSLEYTAFAVKIVFTSSNSSAIPTIRDFRAIAVT